MRRQNLANLVSRRIGQAREKFKDHVDHMSFRVCDISKDPVQQSFEAGSYDIVVASHVLHATNNLPQSLRNIRALLKPQGKLLLFETTVPDAIPIGFAFGLLQGWWDPLDHESRSKLSPCLTIAAWAEVLKCNGFSGVDIEIPGQEELECRYSSIIVSTATDDTALIPSPHLNGRITLVLDPEVDGQRELAKSLQSAAEVSNVHLDVQTLAEAADQSSTLPSLILSLLEIDNVFLNGIDHDNYKRLQSLLTQNKTVLWVSRDVDSWSEPRHHLVDGVGRTLMSEDYTRKFTTLCIESHDTWPGQIAATIFDLIRQLLTLPSEELENNYVLRRGVLHTNRIVEQPRVNEEVSQAILPLQQVECVLDDAPQLTLDLPRAGEIDAIRWVQGDADTLDGTALGEDEIVIDIKAIGLNTRDRLVVSGMLHGETKVSTTDCAGVIARAGHKSTLRPGQRVCALHHSTNRTRIRTSTNAAAAIPDDMSFSTAASLPTALWLAYHALVDLARLEKEETILIHDAHSSFGQLAVQIAQRVGADILATTSTDEKRLFLQEHLALPESSILTLPSSRTPDGIYQAMCGRKVNVIVGAFPQDSLSQIVPCVRPFGRIVNVNPDLSRSPNASVLDLKNISLSSVDLMSVLQEDADRALKTFHRSLAFAFETGVQPPKDLHVFDARKSADAFAHLLDANAFGKRVITLEQASVTVSL
jgi:NADPH:quinone reductase-like Zn-dependent oxidoreductase